MVDRIFIGREGNEHIFRISKPGYDAKQRNNPMIVSSEQDYLAIHHKFTNVQFRRRSFSSDARIYEYGAYLEYPQLPYVPYIQITRSTESYTFPIRYPYASDADFFGGPIGCVATNNAVWLTHTQYIYGSGDPYAPYADVTIYKNRL